MVLAAPVVLGTWVAFEAVTFPLAVDEIEGSKGVPEVPVLSGGVAEETGAGEGGGCVAVLVPAGAEDGGVGGAREILVGDGPPGGWLDCGGEVSEFVTVRDEVDAGGEKGGGIDVDATMGE